MKRNLLLAIIISLSVGILISCTPSSPSDYDDGQIRVVSTNYNNIYLLKASPKRGYYFDSYLILPGNISSSKNLLVEVNNDGSSSQRSFSEETGYVGERLTNYASYKLGRMIDVPVLIPAITRPRDAYTHALSYEAIHCLSDSLERIDQQLVAAIKDVQTYLNTTWRANLDPKILMYGYSAGGMFVSRFALLYPELIQALCAGGNQGAFSLPVSEYAEKTLDFPLGTADYRTLIGHDFVLEDWRQIKMFLYNGEVDSNDSITPSDCWPTAMSSIILSELGDTLKTRTETVSSIYRQNTDNAQFVIYRQTGHRQAPIDDVADFFSKNMCSEALVPIKPSKGYLEY